MPDTVLMGIGMRLLGIFHTEAQMPVHIEKRGEKFRLVDPNGRIAKNAAGTALDGGGHKSRTAAGAQARAVNANTKGKK